MKKVSKFDSFMNFIFVCSMIVLVSYLICLASTNTRQKRNQEIAKEVVKQIQESKK